MAILCLGGGIRNLAAYEPVLLKGKYQFGRVDTWGTATASNYSKRTGYFTVWIPELYGNSTSGFYGYSKLAGGEQSLRESWSPSAMVDTNGTLYTLTFYAFQSLSDGPKFMLSKFVPNASGAVSSQTAFLYGGKVPGDGSGDYAVGHSTDYTKGRIFVRYIPHHILSPTIAQEVGNETSLYIVGLGAPSGVWGVNFDVPGNVWYSGDNNCIFHLRLWQISKNNIGAVEKSKTLELYGGSGDVVQNAWAQPLRSYQSYSAADGTLDLTNYQYFFKPQPEWGGLRAIVTDKIDIYKGKNNGLNGKYCDVKLYGITCSKSTLEREGGYGSIGSMGNVESAALGNVVTSGGVGYFGMTNPNHNLYIQKPGVALSYAFWAICRCPFLSSPAAGRYTPGVCMHPNNGTPILCYTDFTYNMNWGTSVDWDNARLSCNVYAKRAPDSNSVEKTFAQNTLYVTDALSSEAVNAYADYKNNVHASDTRHLYLNTQHLAYYAASSGNNYIIYAYCYPGKSKQLYLGYAACDVVSNRHIRLRPKYEFRDKNGDSFGDFTNCSRIISMDLKNGHLWITFMSVTSDIYFYFHILAKDLVGE